MDCVFHVVLSKASSSRAGLITSGAECVRVLGTLGYVAARQRGSHLRLHCAGRAPVTVPLHQQLNRGTLRAILRRAEIEVQVFLGALGN